MGKWDGMTGGVVEGRVGGLLIFRKERPGAASFFVAGAGRCAVLLGGVGTDSWAFRRKWGIGDNGWRWRWSRAAGSGCGGGGLGIMDGDGDGAGLLGQEAGAVLGVGMNFFGGKLGGKVLTYIWGRL